MDNNLNTSPTSASTNRPYMLLQSQNAKVYLISSKNGKRLYAVQVGDSQVKLSFFMESWLVMKVYSPLQEDFAMISGWLRDIDSSVGSDEIKKTISKIKADHPLHQTEFSFDDIPLIATKNNYCTLPSGMFRHHVNLILEEEEEVLHIMRSNFEPWEHMVRWFQEYCNKYGVESRLKRDRGQESGELVATFCQIHGVSEKQLINKKIKLLLKDLREEIGGNAFGVLVLVGMPSLGWVIASTDYLVLDLIGFAMFFGPLLLIFGKTLK